MGDTLLPFPLTERSVHLCVDMQRIFSVDGPWPAPWMERVPRRHSGGPSSRANRLHPFHPARAPGSDAGMWQRYYTRWREATREFLNLDLLEMPPLAALCPPATVIDKRCYSGFAEPSSSRICASGKLTR